MRERKYEQAQREPPRRLRGRTAGVTLLEVMIAAAIAVVVIAGLAAASMSAARTNREAATLGAPERALHEALAFIAADLRTNNGSGTYRCGQGGTRTANAHDVTWRTYRVTLNAQGNPTEQVTCGTAQQQGTLLVRASTQDGNATHTRETLVSLTRSATTPRIATFTSSLTEVRPGETITVSWQLEPNPPAGTVTYLDGDRVNTDPNTLRGSTSLQVTETTTLELVADSPFGSDRRAITIQAGNAPIFRALRTTPERYTPGEPLTFHWEIDPAPLTLTSAQRLAANGVAARALPTTPGGNGRITGQHTITVPAVLGGTLDFPFAAASTGGTTRKTMAVPECPLPSISLSADRTRITRTGSFSADVTVSWATSNAASASLSFEGTPTNLSPGQVASGSRTERLRANEGRTVTYDFTLTATSDCGRVASETVRVTLVADERPPAEPDPDPDPSNPGGPGGGDPSNPNPPPPLECKDVDMDHLYCACSEGPPPKVVCLPRDDDPAPDPGDPGGPGGGPPVFIDD